MTNPPKKSVGTANDKMPELNAALANAVPRNEDDAMYPLFVRFTYATDTTHLTRSIGPFTRYFAASNVLDAAREDERVRLACIFDSEGQPVA